MNFQNLEKDLLKIRNPEKALLYARFFKTGKGEYGEGDIFLGLNIPQQQIIFKKYKDLTLIDLEHLIKNKYHECRSVAIMILVNKYKKSDLKDKEKIVKFYLKNSKNINNWDLVDVSAPHILGDWFIDKDKSILYKYAHSNNLWQKRISILTTFGFIRKNQFKDSLKIAEILLYDKHDLIHKAVGWMLREIGKRDLHTEERFLDKYYKTMPRTALRYAIEKFSETKRKHYLNK